MKNETINREALDGMDNYELSELAHEVMNNAMAYYAKLILLEQSKPLMEIDTNLMREYRAKHESFVALKNDSEGNLKRSVLMERILNYQIISMNAFSIPSQLKLL